MTSKSIRFGKKTILSSLALIAAFAISPATARANTVDPLVVNAAVACGTSYTCVGINALTFGFSGGGSVLHFTNLSGVDWTNLILTETGVAAANISCTSNIFNCSVSAMGANGARIVLTAFGSLIGVPAGQSFELGFGCKGGGCTAWSDVHFSGSANVVPEPASATLLLTGIGMLLAATLVRRRSVGVRPMLS